VRRADILTTFTCRMSWNLCASASWNRQDLSMPCRDCITLTSKCSSRCWIAMWRATCVTSRPPLVAPNCYTQPTPRRFYIFRSSFSIPYCLKEETLLLGNARGSSAPRRGDIVLCKTTTTHYLFPPVLNTIQDYRYTDALKLLWFQHLLIVLRKDL